MNAKNYTEALGVDVGHKRVGIARASKVARLPEPICTLKNDDSVIRKIHELVTEYSSDVIVVGLPRNLSGDDTDQTRFSRKFADGLGSIGVRVELQDEALTSEQARDLLKKGVYKKNTQGDLAGVDEVAACIILSDFIGEVI